MKGVQGTSIWKRHTGHAMSPSLLMRFSNVVMTFSPGWRDANRQNPTIFLIVFSSLGAVFLSLDSVFFFSVPHYITVSDSSPHHITSQNSLTAGFIPSPAASFEWTSCWIDYHLRGLKLNCRRHIRHYSRVLLPYGKNS